jgi:PIN domain nuclease of toxin-antitoxin system
MFLLDTHTILWYLKGDKNLSKKVQKIIDSKSICYYSIISFWEIAIKQSLGKLQLEMSIGFLENYCKKIGFEKIDLKINHIEQIELLPFIHKDPFDRILISQAITENLTILSKDENFEKYPVSVIW